MKLSEINLRVWNTRSKEMIYFNLSQLNILREVKMHWEIYNVMIATRIKDERGKDVFEGDIVKADGYFGEFLAEVIFDNKTAQFKLKKIDGEEFILKPLGTEYIPDFFKAMKAFSGAKEGATPEEMLKNIIKEDVQQEESYQKY